MIAKSSGCFRINFKPVNSFVVYKHFKMEGLDTAKSLIRHGDFLAKISLKYASLTVHFLVNLQKSLRFLWREQHFYSRVSPLPFVPRRAFLLS